MPCFPRSATARRPRRFLHTNSTNGSATLAPRCEANPAALPGAPSWPRRGGRRGAPTRPRGRGWKAGARLPVGGGARSAPAARGVGAVLSAVLKRGRGAVRGAEGGRGALRVPLASAAALGRDLRGRGGSGAARVGGRAGAARTRQGSSPSEGFSQPLRGAGCFSAVCLRRRIAPLPLQLYSRGHRQRQPEIALKRSR